jgi:hypothetical protein
MFTIGQKVVCIDDKFIQAIAKLYTALPTEGVTYVIRDLIIGQHQPGGEGDVCVLLIGLVNPKSNSRAALERGFSETRFRPLQEKHTTQNEPQQNKMDRRIAAPVTPISISA